MTNIKVTYKPKLKYIIKKYTFWFLLEWVSIYAIIEYGIKVNKSFATFLLFCLAIYIFIDVFDSLNKMYVKKTTVIISD